MRARLVLLGVSLLLIGTLAAQVSPVLNPPRWDELIVVYDAQRIASGQVPYRDFFNFIPPGIFLALAPLGPLSGGHYLTAARYASSAVLLLTSFLLALGLHRAAWPSVAATLWAAVPAVALYGFWGVPSHHWFAALCSAGVVALLAGSPGAQSWRWLAAGALAGLAATFVQTAGLGLAAFVLVLAVLEPPSRRAGAAWAAAGICAVWGPLLVGLALLGAAGDFLRDVILWPMQNYSRGGNENAGAVLQDLPWRLGDLAASYWADPSLPRALVTAAGFALYAAVVMAFALVLWAALYAVGRTLRERAVRAPWRLAASFAVILAAGLSARGNVNWLHLVYLLACLGPLVLVSLPRWGSWRRGSRVLAQVLLGVLLAAGFLYQTRGLWFHAPAAWEFVDVDRLLREQPVNAWLRSPGVLALGDTLAAFPEGGEVYLYAAPAAVGYTYFRPLSERYNSAEDHAAVARQIDQRRPKFILVPPDMERDYLDPASPVGVAIASRYARDRLVGNAVVYRLRPKAGHGGARP